MALIEATLKTELKKIIDPATPGFAWPATVAAAANNWATAYNTYAATATDMYMDVLVAGNTALFASMLVSMLPPIGDYSTTASAFDAAFSAYWLAAMFNIGSSPILPPGFFVKLTSIVTVVTPGVLAAGLLPNLPLLANDPTATPDTVAGVWAAAFHAATTTAVLVVVAGTTPPPPAAPIVTPPQPIL